MFYCFKWGSNTFFFLVINFHTWIFLAIQQVLVLLIILLIKKGTTSLFSQECFLQVPKGKPCCQFPADAGSDTHSRGECGGETRERLILFDHQAWKNWMHLCKQFFFPPSSFLTWRNFETPAVGNKRLIKKNPSLCTKLIAGTPASLGRLKSSSMRGLRGEWLKFTASSLESHSSAVLLEQVLMGAGLSLSKREDWWSLRSHQL